MRDEKQAEEAERKLKERRAPFTRGGLGSKWVFEEQQKAEGTRYSRRKLLELASLSETRCRSRRSHFASAPFFPSPRPAAQNSVPAQQRE